MALRQRDIPAGQADIDAEVAALDPAEVGECGSESLGPTNISGTDQHADAPQPSVLLRPRRQRPRRRRCAKDGEEGAAVHVCPRHSITSSAMASSEGGTGRSNIRAVSALMTSSNLDACMTGTSAGFAPLRMRPVRSESVV